MSPRRHADLSHGSADDDSTVGGWQFDAGARKARPSTTRRRDFATRFCADAGSAPIARRTQRPIAVMSSFTARTAQQTRHLLFEAVIKGALRRWRLGFAPRFAR